VKKLLLAGIAALFLATGTVHAQELIIHHGNNGAMLLLEKADRQKHATMIETRETCWSILETIEACSKNGLETWIEFTGGKPEKIIGVSCIGEPSKQCPPNIAGKTPESGKAC